MTSNVKLFSAVPLLFQFASTKALCGPLVNKDKLILTVLEPKEGPYTLVNLPLKVHTTTLSPLVTTNAVNGKVWPEGCTERKVAIFFKSKV